MLGGRKKTAVLQCWLRLGNGRGTHGDCKRRGGLFPVMMVVQSRVEKGESARKAKSSEPVLHSIYLYVCLSIIPLYR